MQMEGNQEIGIIEEVDIEIPIMPLKWQNEVSAELSQFNVIAAGRRSGKTLFSLLETIHNAITDWDSTNWYVAPTYTMAKNIAWDELKYLLKNLRKMRLIQKINDSELLIKFIFGSIIQLKGADAPDSLRGMGLDHLVLDEFAVMKPEVWYEVLRPSLADKNGRVIFTSTPKGYNHFHDVYQMRNEYPNLWKSFHIKTSEAGTIDAKEIAQAKRDMDERVFKQEFEASFEVFGGQVFADFDRNKHAGGVLSFKNDFEYDIGMDFGWASPTVALFIQVDLEENVYVFDEIRAIETPIVETGKAIRDKNYKRVSTTGHMATKEPDTIFCDPAGDAKSEATGSSSVAELKKMGFIVKYTKKYPGVIQDRISLIRKWLRNGKLFISSKCINTIQAMEMYRYPEPKGDIKTEIPLKDGVSDHWIDALGEFFINRFGVKKSEWRAE